MPTREQSSWVSDFRSISFTDLKDTRCDNIGWMSHVDPYRGTGGLPLKISFINLDIDGWRDTISRHCDR